MRLQDFRPDMESLDSLTSALRFCLTHGGDPSEICRELVDRLRMNEEQIDGLLSRVARLEEDLTHADEANEDLHIRVEVLLATNDALKQDVTRLRSATPLDTEARFIGQHRAMCEWVLRSLPVPTQLEYDLYALEGKKIQMIKAYRDRTGLGLAECKHACDAHIFLKEARSW